MSEIKQNIKAHIYNAESVGKGHPDKICDQISDAILDEALKQDPNAHIACETAAMNNVILVGGEIKTTATINVLDCVWKVLIPLGYSYTDFTIISNLNQQSSEIDAKVEKTDNTEVGAGDQGITTGYATDEGKTFNIKNHNYLPLESLFASELLRYLDERKNKNDIEYAKYLGYDQKSQVELIKDFETKTLTIKKIILALQHQELNQKEYKVILSMIKDDVVKFFKERFGIDVKPEIIAINAAGTFIHGGPHSDSGLTGRKLVVDNYGPHIQIGGGAYSGKDCTKVDRTGAYTCRWIAKNLVANGYVKKCSISLAWEIGLTHPDNIYIDVASEDILKPDVDLYALIAKEFNDLKLGWLIETLQLKKPIYSKYDTFGHFSNNKAPWEKIIKM